MITVDDLKKPGLWRFTAHADGRGFAVNFYEAEVAGVTIKGSKRLERGKVAEVTYAIGADFTCHTLAQVAEYLNQRFIAGDETRGIGTDD